MFAGFQDEVSYEDDNSTIHFIDYKKVKDKVEEESFSDL